MIPILQNIKPESIRKGVTYQGNSFLVRNKNISLIKVDINITNQSEFKSLHLNCLKLINYKFYQIEISIGQCKCYPIVDMKEYYQFTEKFNYVKSLIESMQISKHLTPQPPISEFCLMQYAKSLWEDRIIKDYVKQNYNLEAANEM